MITFQTVRTARFSFTLRELSIGQIRALYNIPPEFLEKQRSAFLKYALAEFQFNKGYEDLTLDDLTVQERLFIEATYLSSVSDNPDFSLANGKYTDFLLIEQQFKKPFVELGNIPSDDDIWFMRPLTGLMLESIEERALVAEKPDRLNFILYAMATQLYRKTEELPDIHTDFVKFGDWLDERVEKLKALPESAFIALLLMFFKGQEELTHLFAINFDDSGVSITSTAKTMNEQGEEVAVLPARFRSSAKFTVITQRLFGKYREDDE